jgi:hypothetical protein
MTTSYPSSLDSFTNPTATDTLDSATVPHAAQHDNLNDAVKAVETALGANLVNVAQIASANTFTGGVQQITTASASTKGLIVQRGTSGQTANILEVNRQDGNNYIFVNAAGNLNAQGTTFLTNTQTGGGTSLAVSTGFTTSSPLVVKGAASQTADLQQWQNSAGTVLSGFNAAGQLYAGTTASVVGSTTTALTSAAYTSATVAVFTYGGTSLVQAGQRVTVAGVTGGAYNGTWTVSAVTSTTFTVLGSGFTNNAGTGGTFTLSAVGSFVAGTAAITPLVVQGAASQTANLQQWQNSAGTVGAAVKSDGTILATYFDSLLQTGSYFQFTSGSQVSVIGRNAGAPVLVTRGAASQTADLQQWQNSAGTVLTSVTSAGTINFASGNTATTATAGALTAPALVTGYITMQIAGTTVKVPYYAN